MMQKHSSIFVAGHRGLVGSAILRRLQAEGLSGAHEEVAGKGFSR